MAAQIQQGAISVEGLNEAIRGLKKTDSALGRVVSKASRDLVRTVIVPPAVRNWQSQRIKPSVASQVVKPGATQSTAEVRLRYSKFPYAAGVEYGSKQFRQFKPWRGNQYQSGDGAVVREAVEDNIDKFMKKWQGEVVDAIDRFVDGK